MEPSERDIWYAISLVSAGVVMIGVTNQTGLGEFLTIAGGLWVLYIERTRIREAIRKFLISGGRFWPPLNQRQISELRNRLAAIPTVIEERDFRRIQILRAGFPDCADLADDIAEAFRSAWANPNILPGKPWGDLKEGIWIVGPRGDPRSPILLSILSEVLGTQYEPIGLDPTPPAPLDLALSLGSRSGESRGPDGQTGL